MSRCADPDFTPTRVGVSALAVDPQVVLRRDNRVALVLSDSPISSLQFTKAGWTPELYHPRALNGNSLKHVGSLIQNGQFGLVWLELPVSGKTVAPKRWSTSIDELSRWLRVARTSGVPATMIAPRGRQ